jgi:hypothetical protein
VEKGINKKNKKTAHGTTGGGKGDKIKNKKTAHGTTGGGKGDKIKNKKTAHGTTGGGKGDGTVLWVCQRSVRLGSVYEPAQVVFPSAEVLMQCPKRLVMKKKLKCLCNVIKGPL